MKRAATNRLVLILFACLSAVVAEADDIPTTNPYSGNDAAIKSGRSWYQNVCGTCHGATANGAGERGQGADLRKFKLGFRGFVDVVKSGRKVPGQSAFMPAWGGVLDDKSIYEIGAYLETLALQEANWKEGVKN